ncbi:SGNH hydrolase, partial [Cadophora sp. DSE1049]
YPQIILFGDSLTQFMTTNIQSWLQTRYSRRADIINRGFGGYTSQQGLSLLPQIIPSKYPVTSPNIKLCFVFFGANDAFQPPQTPGRPRVDLGAFSSNVCKIVEYLQSLSEEMTVVLITPPAVDEYSLPHTGLTSERIASYASATRDIATRYGLPLVDCSKIFLQFSGWSESPAVSFLPGSKRVAKNDALASLLTDGLHLSVKGYEILFHEIVEVIEEKIP